MEIFRWDFFSLMKSGAVKVGGWTAEGVAVEVCIVPVLLDQV